MMYILPTRGPGGYRGTRPNHVRSFSTSATSTDKDGKRCCHVETYNGTRYTISNDLMRRDITNGVGDRHIEDLLLDANTPSVVMTQAEYDDWLAHIRAARGAK